MGLQTNYYGPGSSLASDRSGSNDARLEGGGIVNGNVGNASTRMGGNILDKTACKHGC